MDWKWRKLVKKSEGTRDKQTAVSQHGAWDCIVTTDQKLYYAANHTWPGVEQESEMASQLETALEWSL